MTLFPKRLKDLRTENNMTRVQLAERLNISVRLVSYWENGERECNFDMLVKLAQIFDVSVDYLLGIKDY